MPADPDELLHSPLQGPHPQLGLGVLFGEELPKLASDSSEPAGYRGEHAADQVPEAMTGVLNAAAIERRAFGLGIPLSPHEMFRSHRLPRW